MARRPHPARGSASTGPAGFTLVELMVVVALGALLAQLVAGNLGAMIPSKAMDGAARQIVAQLDFLRSEARLQGKTYRLDLDLGNHQYRTVMPPEDRLLSTENEQEEFSFAWKSLGDEVRFAGLLVAGRTMLRSGIAGVAFDENGFTADQTLFLVHPDFEDMVWSIQLRGLVGTADILPSHEGVLQALDTATEASF
ncbi:MAG: prepilin-type N-terminal cleavage/methylation domain-containing protein [Planctomycetota bacterium]